MNEPLRQVPPVEPAPEPPAPAQGRSIGALIVTGLVWLLGVILPVVTLGIELNSRMCANEFFDPLPTPVHVLLVACVPAASVLALCATRWPNPRLLSAAFFLNGLAIAVGVVYAAIFLPLVPLAIIAVLIMGMGLLPLAPLLSLIMSLVLRRRLVRAWPSGTRAPRPWLAMGMAGVAFIAAEAPATGTRLALQAAVSEHPEMQRAALQWLRRLGHEPTLLAACYVAPQRASLLNFVLSFDDTVSLEEARTTYYRVTGRTFNSVPKPENLRAGEFFRFEDDMDQGGQQVGGRVPGLSLASSELKGSVDGDAALAYLEWTMAFETSAEGQSEARTQIALPPGAVVSRVTLFIDGQEREAAFAGNRQVREAYEKVVQTRRDPLLVTQKGPDRIQVQCFPVVKGPPMKIKLGITAPLVPKDEGRFAALALPTLAERNFHIAEDFRHVVRVESRRPLSLPAGGGLEQRGDGVSEWLTALSDETLLPPQAVLTVERKGAADMAWTEDMVEPEAYFIRQQVRRSVAELPARVLLVLDGSEGMKDAMPEVASALASFPPGMELAVLASMDGVEELLPLGQVDAAALQRAAERVRALPTAGGQDANAALERAWSLVAPEGRTVVVWVHGPHPLAPAPLARRSERGQGVSFWWMGSRPPAEILDVRVGRGPDRLAEEVGEYASFRTVPRIDSLEQDLERLFTSWSHAAPEFHRERLPVAELALPPEAWKTSSHLARLWAREEISRLVLSREDEAVARAMELGARHQLVTELTGAVVLERQEQYDEAGLKPVEPGTVPSVPEPETWMLLAVACALVLVSLRLRRVR